MILTVNRSIWHRGKEAAEKDAFIYNSDTNKWDIIGILLQCAGVSKSMMDKTRLPSAAAHLFLPNKRRFEAPLNWLVTPSHADTADTLALIKINDDPSYKEEEREEKIQSFLYDRGISVIFKDDAGSMKPAAAPRRDLLDDEDVWETPRVVSIRNRDDDDF